MCLRYNKVPLRCASVGQVSSRDLTDPALCREGAEPAREEELSVGRHLQCASFSHRRRVRSWCILYFVGSVFMDSRPTHDVWSKRVPRVCRTLKTCVPHHPAASLPNDFPQRPPLQLVCEPCVWVCLCSLFGRASTLTASLTSHPKRPLSPPSD